ncbi:MAG: pyridoxal phosphate-dependent aminotransferase [Desulfobacteraceae bacterium]|nr:pyridoxal phosphate-dependent aminotransferase [Desulfobacteraceae bacterium]
MTEAIISKDRPLPGTVVHYDEIGRIMGCAAPKITGNPNAFNAHVGGQFFSTPHPMALGAQRHQALHYTGLLGYLAQEAEKKGLPLADFLKEFSPENGFFIDLYVAYEELWQRSGHRHLEFGCFLDLRKQEKIFPTGYLDHCHGQTETLVLMAHYFKGRQVPATPDQVVMGTGFKNLFNALMTVLMKGEVRVDAQGRDFRESKPGTILVPRGHYQSLVKAPSFHNGRLKVIERMDEEHIREALENREDIKAVYFSVVANPSGDVMPEAQIRGIARAILEYNASHPEDPVFVVADQVYNGSLLKEGLEILSIASLTGDRLDMEDDSAKSMAMFDYTVTIVSPSKTLGYASARIGFAASNARIPGDLDDIITRMGNVLGHEGSDGVEVSAEKGALGAYAFTPLSWIDANSGYVKGQLARARHHVATINRSLGKEFFTINDPDAGWYILSSFPRKHLPLGIRDSTDLMAWFMGYARFRKDTGVIVRPGSQFGLEAPNFEPRDHLILRSTLAMKPADLDEFFGRLAQGITKLDRIKQLESLTAPKLAAAIETAHGLEQFILGTAQVFSLERLTEFIQKPGLLELSLEEVCMLIKALAMDEVAAVLSFSQ